MYQFEKKALARKIAPRVKGQQRGRVFVIACDAVRGSGITHQQDVGRLAKEICSILGVHGATATAAKRAR